MPAIIQTFWHGKLTSMEHMCLKSFLRQGHSVHLYTYRAVLGAPEGIIIKDANAIVPVAAIDRFQNLANFSDYFRYSLLLQNGGYWCDSDVFCFKPFDFSEPYVFSSQRVINSIVDEINSGVIKIPARSEMMAYCLRRVNNMDVATTHWSAIGPALMLESHRKFNLVGYKKSHQVFCPLHYFEAPENVMGPSTGEIKFGPETYAVHLWNEEMRRVGMDKDAPHPGSLYDRLKAQS